MRAQLHLVRQPEPETVDEAAEALAALSPGQATRALIAAYHEARSAFDREVAESRKRADALLAVIMRYLDGESVGDALPHDCTHAVACECDERNGELFEQYAGFWSLDDFPTALARELAKGRYFCAAQVLEGLRRSVVQDFQHVHIPSGARIREAFDAAAIAHAGETAP